MRADEWLEYSVEVDASGLYTFGARVGMLGEGGTFHLEVDGSDVSGALQVPNTGGWYNWATVEKTDVILTAGEHVLRLAMDANGPGGSVGVFDALELALQPAGRPSGPALDDGPAVPYLVDVQTSGGWEPYTNGWHVVDGDEETMWVGTEGAGGWWLVLAYDRDVSVNRIDVVCDQPFCTNFTVLGSFDAEEWFEMSEALAATNPVSAGYLWFIFADDGTEGNGQSWDPSISANGQYVTFDSLAFLSFKLSP